MFRPNFDPLIGIWGIPYQNKNESLHKTDTCNVLSDWWLEVHSAIQRLFMAAAAAVTGLWTEHQTAWEIVSFLSFRPNYVFNYFFYEFYIFIILDSKNFQTIQTAMYYKKKSSKRFKCNFVMFLDNQRSCDQNKKWNIRKKIPVERGLRYLIGWIV